MSEFAAPGSPHMLRNSCRLEEAQIGGHMHFVDGINMCRELCSGLNLVLPPHLSQGPLGA